MSNELKNNWIAPLLFIFTLACASPEAPNTQSALHEPSWTTCINEHGFEHYMLSSPSNVPDGLSEVQGRLAEVYGTNLDYRCKITSDKGAIRNLRLIFELNETHSTDSIYAELFNRMKEVYGAASPTQSYATWRAATTQGTLMEIELMDGSMLYQRNEILVHWEEHKDRLYED